MSISTGCTVRTTNGRPTKTIATATPGGRERDLEPQRLEEPPQPAVLRVERGQRDARDRGGQRERQIDQRVDQALAPEFVARQHPRDDQAEHDVDRGDAANAAPNVNLVGGQRARRRRPPPQNPAQPSSADLNASPASGMSTMQAEVGERVPERQAEARGERRGSCWPPTGRHAGWGSCRRSRAGLGHLIEDRAVGEVGLLRLGPAAERLVDGHQRHLAETWLRDASKTAGSRGR